MQFSYLVDPLAKPNVVDNMKFRNVVLLMARSRVVGFFQDLNSLNELKTTEHAGIELGCSILVGWMAQVVVYQVLEPGALISVRDKFY